MLSWFVVSSSTARSGDIARAGDVAECPHESARCAARDSGSSGAVSVQVFMLNLRCDRAAAISPLRRSQLSRWALLHRLACPPPRRALRDRFGGLACDRLAVEAIGGVLVVALSPISAKPEADAAERKRRDNAFSRIPGGNGINAMSPRERQGFFPTTLVSSYFSIKYFLNIPSLLKHSIRSWSGQWIAGSNRAFANIVRSLALVQCKFYIIAATAARFANAVTRF